MAPVRLPKKGREENAESNLNVAVAPSAPHIHFSDNFSSGTETCFRVSLLQLMKEELAVLFSSAAQWHYETEYFVHLLWICQVFFFWYFGIPWWVINVV